MLLRVQYNTGRYDMIKDSFLDKLIASGKIVRFYRSTGWVFVGRGRVHGNERTPALKDGAERRQ